MSRELVLVDGENVRRSLWPNLSAAEVVDRCSAWGATEGLDVEVVFDGKAPPVAATPGLAVAGSGGERADAVISRRAAELRAAGTPFWLVTSDRALRAEAGVGAERLVGGGSFARWL